MQGSRKSLRSALVVLLPAATVLLAIAPFVLSAYGLRIFSMAFMYASLAQAINLIAGFTGYPAFGNVVFFGIGSYCVGIIMVKAGGSFVTGLLLAILMSGCVAVLVGPALLRLRGHYFAIATVGLNEAVKAVAANLSSLTGGGMGLSLPLPPWSPLEGARVFYYLLFATMIAGIIITARVQVSRLGFAARAIRDDEVKAEALGLRTTTVKTAMWAISASLTGAVGGIYAFWFSYIEPPAVFDMLIATKAFVIFLVGGAATVFGPIVAAFLIEYASTLLWSHLLDYHLGALGLGIILVTLYMPDGILRFSRERFQAVARMFRSEM